MTLEYQLNSYDFDLPSELIAQHPPEHRHGGRLLVTRRGAPSSTDATILDLPRLLPKGAVLVVNNTQVVPARLLGHKPSGGRVELLLVSPLGSTHDRLEGQPVITRSNKPLKIGQQLTLDGGATATVRELPAPGRAVVDLHGQPDLPTLLARCGHLPLPPYIRQGTEQGDDRERYQCTFAAVPGAVAAPTAGLHLSAEVMAGLSEAGVTVAPITLHVGPGTFLPVRVGDLREHQVMAERYELGAETAETLNRARLEQRPIIAVGTTCTRLLETVGRRFEPGKLEPHRAVTELTVRPGHNFVMVDGLLSNFHLPKSSLLVLVSAFAGRQCVLDAYAHAIERRYRFYSYGDATLWL